MRSSPHKVDGITLDLVDQQEVTTDMTLSMIGPLTLQCVVQPLGTQRRVICDEDQHGIFEPHHVIAPGVAKTLPVFQESLGVIRRPWQRRTFTGGCFFQDRPAMRQRRQIWLFAWSSSCGTQQWPLGFLRLAP